MKIYTDVLDAERDLRHSLSGRVSVLVAAPANRWLPARIQRWQIAGWSHVPPAFAGVHENAH